MIEDDPFESPKSLLQWAGGDLANIDQALVDWVNDNACETFFQNDPNVPGGVLHGYALSKGIPPQLRRDVQRVSDELKKALDQSLYHAIRLVHKELRKDVWFPWGKDPDDLEKRLLNRHIPDVLKPVIRALEPYPRGDHYPGGDNIFRALGKISGPSRHRTSLTVGASVESRIDARNLRTYSVARPYNRTKNEVIVLGLFPDPGANYNVQASVYISFDHPELRHAQVNRVLRHWFNRVAAAVLFFEHVALEFRRA